MEMEDKLGGVLGDSSPPANASLRAETLWSSPTSVSAPPLIPCLQIPSTIEMDRKEPCNGPLSDVSTYSYNSLLSSEPMPSFHFRTPGEKLWRSDHMLLGLHFFERCRSIYGEPFRSLQDHGKADLPSRRGTAKSSIEVSTESYSVKFTSTGTYSCFFPLLLQSVKAFVSVLCRVQAVKYHYVCLTGTKE